ncbi:MAG: response regulator [Candidatus Portnoybacteria bacterium CG06_land_8_20_14_3_00_39_12]|uniref:Response regulator n=2 Tax=Candidatus Portnoyibacteriota TaxID=1817913 RepID=A0A2M8KFH7_9BACT|nr:MAG: hypothetical protein AUJ33_01290 [Parcubacteria group bacterium CG1_02_40_25]PIU75040.1 MAG: response regulator [Candidatus Portnoybacteria bacterium CG06_land_8_20_14_3_00_39_12]PJE58696.1 MAG: response regulator [Candidatus Portnoybacteria bacterium CG10_big_fil_rev_8_21_14_0_10_40_22]
MSKNKSKKILFIEDEPDLQRAMGEYFIKAGFNILKAIDGEIGLNLARKELPDIILLDLILPKMDGFQVLVGLKNDPETKNIPVVVLTNLEGTIDVEKALRLGATTYLVKANYDLSELVERIKQFIK